MAVVLGVLLLAAPAVAFCPCERPAPKQRAPMNCAGMSHCCCGDADSSSAPSQTKDCPRAEKSVDAAEIAEKSTEPGPIALPFLSVLSTVERALPGLPTLSEGLPPPSHPPHLVLTALLL